MSELVDKITATLEYSFSVSLSIAPSFSNLLIFFKLTKQKPNLKNERFRCLRKRYC